MLATPSAKRPLLTCEFVFVRAFSFLNLITTGDAFQPPVGALTKLKGRGSHLIAVLLEALLRGEHIHRQHILPGVCFRVLLRDSRLCFVLSLGGGIMSSLNKSTAHQQQIDFLCKDILHFQIKGLLRLRGLRKRLLIRTAVVPLAIGQAVQQSFIVGSFALVVSKFHRW